MRYAWLQYVFPRLHWSTGDESIAITFDDGPHPEITPWVLNVLRKAEVKATFFLVGEAVRRNPELLEVLRAEGHSIGGHTMHHLDLWKTNKHKFIEDVMTAQVLIGTKLFRPPYGHFRKSVARRLLEEENVDDVVMWSLLSGDYVLDMPPEKCWLNIKKNLRPGDVLVFHDSEKARERMEYALPRTLELIHEKGWKTSRF